MSLVENVGGLDLELDDQYQSQLSANLSAPSLVDCQPSKRTCLTTLSISSTTFSTMIGVEPLRTVSKSSVSAALPRSSRGSPAKKSPSRPSVRAKTSTARLRAGCSVSQSRSTGPTRSCARKGKSRSWTADTAARSEPSKPWVHYAWGSMSPSSNPWWTACRWMLTDTSAPST